MTKGLLLFGAASALFGLGVTSAPQDSRTAEPKPDSGSNVGSAPEGLSALGLSGTSVQAPVPGAKATVVAFSSLTCPLCQKYGPTLAALEDSYRARGAAFVFVNPTSDEPAGDMRKLVERLGLDGPYVHDPQGSWARALQAKTTTEAFVLDKSGKIVYRGAIDDQYAIGAALPEPRNRYLADALDAVLAGNPVKVPFTSAPGCLLNPEVEAGAELAPSYHGRIEHIVQRSCVPCHRPGGVAPFPLDSYESVKARAEMVKYVVGEGIMPPWFATEGGPWRNDASLAKEDKAALVAWVDGGMPKGDPEDAPTPVAYESGWTIGKPDAVFELPRPVAIKESGTMPYVNVSVPTNFTEDKWVERIEVVPGDRRAVHHVLVFVRTSGAADGDRAERASDPDGRDELGGFFGIYVPGNSVLTYADGLAKRIPKGAVLRFQLHYTPYGQASTDKTKIGLVFAKEPPKSEVHTASLANLRFSIPPGAEDHRVDAQVRVPADVQILSFLPHMHLRAKAARYGLESQGTETTLLDVPRYDFNWQLNYVLEQPLTVHAGDTLTFTAWYDNSEKNPANPDPTKTVRWGSQTFDEMHLGYIEYIVPGEKPGEGGAGALRRAGGAGVGRGSNVQAVFRRLDRDGDGFVTQDEAGLLWNRIQVADEDGDGRLTLGEAKRAFGGGAQ